MSTRLKARLLGEVSFHFGDQVVRPRSRKGVALLAYLAVEVGGARRDVLAETLWGQGKLASVRQALYELRRLPGAPTWLREAGDSVQLAADTDVAQFEGAISGGDTAAALAVYRGELLADEPVLGVPAYQDWLAFHRERLVELRLRALVREAARLETAGLLTASLAVVKDALEADPLNETLHRAAMRLAYSVGDVAAAKEAYLACAATLKTELGVEPQQETQDLARAIERGETLAFAADLNTLPAGRLQLLQAVAIGEGALGVKGIAAVLGRPEFEVAADLVELGRGGLIDDHLAVTARHLTAVMASIPLSFRRLLHERAAEALSAASDADDGAVARHLLAAGDPRRAAPRYLAAAKAAVEKAELDTAVRYLFLACWAAWELPELRLEASLLLEGAASQQADDSLQNAALAEAERLAWEVQSDPQLAEVRMRRSRQHLLKGRVGEGLELALEALEIAIRLGDRSLEARARNAVGGAHFYAGDLDGAAETFAANLAAPDAVESYRAHNNLGSIAAMRGSSEEAYAQFDAALTLARASSQKIDVAATLNNLAATAERLGDYPRAVKHLREGMSLASRNRASGREGRLLNNLAVVYSRQGQLGPAWNTACEMAELADELADPRLRLSALELKADIERLCGLLGRAEAGMRRALVAAQELNDERKAMTLAAQLATVAALNGGSRSAAEAAIEAVESGKWSDMTPWLWLELSLSAASQVAALGYCRRAAQAGVRGPHLAVVADMAVVRARLLPGSDTSSSDAARSAIARLGAGPKAPGSLERLEIFERPLGLLLLAAADSATGGRLDSFEVPPRVRKEVAEQAGGLPRELREQLLAQPDIWLEDLRR